MSDDRAPRAVSSDAAGHFAFEGLGPGSYRLSAERTGFLRHDDVVSISEVQSLSELLVKLTPQAAICGKVVDEEGEAVSNANVVLLRQTGFGSSRRLLKIDWATANDLREFRIPALSPDRYFLAVQGPGTVTDVTDAEGYVPSFYPRSTDSFAAAPIQVRAGETVSGINLTLFKRKVQRIQGR